MKTKEKCKKKKKSKIKLLVSLFVFSLVLLSLVFVSAITFTQIFPTTNPLITNESTVNLSYGIHAGDGLSSITHSWNGTNTTLYDSSLVLFMNFDNRSALGENDTFVRDLSMYENNGTVVGGENITWGADYGKYGGAFNFSGNKNGITSTVNVSQNDLTLSFWYNPKSVQSTALFTVSTGTIEITIHTDNNLRFVLKNESSNTTGTVVAFTYLPNTWDNFIITYNGTHALAYKNSVLQKTTTSIKGRLLAGSSLRIGTNWNLGGAYFNGSIDDVMIWNRSLSASEITYLYNSQITKYNSTYYQLNSTKTTSVFAQPSFLCSKNNTAVEFCTASTTTRKVNTIKSNFSTFNGILSNNYLGTSFVYSFFISTFLDTDGNGVRETPADINWNRELFINSGMKRLITDIGLGNYYSNSTDGSINFTGDISNSVEFLRWANENDIKVLYIIDYTPTWLGDNSTGSCLNGLAYCPPNNYTRFALLLNDWINRVTEGDSSLLSSIELQFWNEPDREFFMYNASIETKSLNYIKFYNATYDLLKANYPSIPIYAPAISTTYSWLTNNDSMILMNNFLANNSNRMDGIAFHSYGVPTISNNYDDALDIQISKVIGNCTIYNANCSKIIISESNIISSSIKNGTSNFSNYGSKYGSGLIYLLNKYPSNITFSTYVWSSPYLENDTTNYPQYLGYPQVWSMVTQPELIVAGQPQFKASYNVTKNFAHLCPAGATVYVTSNDDDTIKQVSCKKGNMYSLIVINTDTTNAKNITLNMSLTNGSVFFPYSKLTNYEDNSDTYTISSGITNLGILDSYEILYLTNDSQVPTITIDSPTNSTYLTSSNWFNISLDEDGSMCYYSLNDGANISLTQSGVLTDFYKYITGLTQIHNTVIFYCNDTYNNWGTARVTFTASTPPTYTDNSVSNTIFGHNVKFEITVTDDVALEDNGQWIFSSDNTGEWKNDTAVNFSSTPETINVKKDIIKFSGDTLSYRWYFTDNAGNTNSTEIYSFTVSCEKETNVMYNLIMICASLLILSIFGFFGWKKVQEGEGVTVGEIIIMIIGISVCIALWLASGQTMGTVCGVIS